MRLPVFQPQSRLSIRRGLGLQDRTWWGTAIAVHAVLHPMGEEKRAASWSSSGSCCNAAELVVSVSRMISWHYWQVCMRAAGTCTYVLMAAKLQVFLFSKWGSVLCLHCSTTNEWYSPGIWALFNSMSWKAKQKKNIIWHATHATFESMIFLVQTFHIHIKNK